jgi:hypothetical protein
VKADAGLDNVRVIFEVVAPAPQDVFEVAEVAEDAIGGGFSEQWPQGFNRLQFRRGRRQKVQDHVGRHLQLLGAMPTGVVENDDENLFSFRIGPGGELGQRLAHQIGADTRQEQPKQSAGLRFGETINIQPVVLGLPVARRSMTAQPPGASAGWLQTQARFVFGPNRDGFSRVLLTESPYSSFQGFFSTPVVGPPTPPADDAAAAPTN